MGCWLIYCGVWDISTTVQYEKFSSLIYISCRGCNLTIKNIHHVCNLAKRGRKNIIFLLVKFHFPFYLSHDYTNYVKDWIITVLCIHIHPISKYNILQQWGIPKKIQRCWWPLKENLQTCVDKTLVSCKSYPNPHPSLVNIQIIPSVFMTSQRTWHNM